MGNLLNSTAKGNGPFFPQFPLFDIYNIGYLYTKPHFDPFRVMALHCQYKFNTSYIITLLGDISYLLIRFIVKICRKVLLKTH